MEIEVLIEISQGSSVKYEFDKENNVLRVDRFLYTAMFFPFNYGYLPNSLSDDGDPVDVLVLSNFSILPGTLIKCQVIGGLEMEDEAGKDEKVIAVPIRKIDPFWGQYQDLDELPLAYRNQIKHFFENYKTLEPNKWVKIKEWLNKEKTIELIKKATLK
ncbi:MAG: inorganic diphosphatase [Patescibacteria group bacterium]|nr:inorganic diphosphatase [Patescibacteria group bacterium]